MTIQMQFGNGTDVEKRQTYREVIRNVNFDNYVQGFFAHRDSWRWGRLVQLKGKEVITLRTFGEYPNGETVTH